MSDSTLPPKKHSNALGWFLFGGSTLGVIILGLLASSILQRRAEKEVSRIQIVQPVAEWEADNSKWGVNFPREFNSWEQTKQMNDNTKFGGSGLSDYLKEDPRLVVLFAGFGFGKDYNSPRGHFHAVEDVTKTKRLSDKTPATCWTCKSPDVPRLMAEKGVSAFYSGKFKDLTSDVKNPIGCADCHDPKTMALRISRPALIEAYQRQGKDINKATHQEMRSLVCAQCHVSYYFKDKKTNYLTFPWDDGLTVESFDKYYQKAGFSDWTHPISNVKMIKVRHPDFEVWQQGVHAFKNVSCADCHMPYKAEGGIKFTDHQIRSPLYNMANSCQVCHRWSETEIKERVYAMQGKNRELLDIAENALVKAHLIIGDAAKLGATDAELTAPRETLRRAQMYWDYVAANNGMGFHAPQECARVLAKATNLAQECRLSVERIRAVKGALQEFVLPDINTKEKALAYVKPYIDAQKAKEAKKVAVATPAEAKGR
jgi:nitrite reductase (cytochrome c-552)